MGNRGKSPFDPKETLFYKAKSIPLAYTGEEAVNNALWQIAQVAGAVKASQLRHKLVHVINL